MKTNRSVLLFACFALGFSIWGCRPAESSPTPTPAEPEAVKTSAAATAQALLTERAPAPTGTNTSAPTATSGSTGTPIDSTDVAGTAVATPPPSGGDDSAEFISDVTIPDGTTFDAGDSFDKTWRLRNNGTSTWTEDYNLVFVSGAQMNGPASQPLAAVVSPGTEVDLSVSLTAPPQPGTQRGFWMLQNPQGENFGVGPEGNQAFYVEINVLGEGGTPIATSPPATGGGIITSLGINVDQGSFTGSCPHTFSFSVQITTSEPALVTLQLVAGSDNPAYTFSLPGPTTNNLGTGTSNFVYTLNLTDSVNGWVIARVTSPEIMDSNTANFSLTCE